MADFSKKHPPKGGRKGGTTFPRINLSNALKYAGKLVSKTHTGPQPRNLVLTGVFGTAGPDGQVRASALRQYTLLEVDDKGYNASSLAKQIEAAPEEDKTPLIRKACLAPGVFKTLFETFHGDDVAKGRIRQQALNLRVHPDCADDCVDLFVSSLETAKLATVSNDRIKVVPSSELVEDALTTVEVADEQVAADEEKALSRQDQLKSEPNENELPVQPDRSRAMIQVNVTLDSSLDTEKLEKQLALLRKYGAI